MRTVGKRHASIGLLSWLLASTVTLACGIAWAGPETSDAASKDINDSSAAPAARYRLANAWHQQHQHQHDLTAEQLPFAVTSAEPAGRAEFFYSLPSQFTYDTLDSLRRPSLLSAFEHAQATVRYAWISRSGWSFKLGVVSALDLDATSARLAFLTADRNRSSTLPLMHLSSETPISSHWLVSVDAQSQHLIRSQSLDLDLKLDYRLTSNLDIYGAYRMADSLADGIDPGFAPAPANLARFGVRLRF
jgi:hypothetical protein